jgi:ABC-type transport system involved in multi-copper enzyme maturation permease subunit
MTAIDTETRRTAAERTIVKKVTFPRVLLSEWTKFRTLRSSWITVGLSLVLLAGFGAIAAFTYSGATVTDGPPGISGRPLDAVSLSLMGLSFTSLVTGVLGVLMSAGEYSTGMIRSSLAAVPKRLPVLWAKALIAFATVFVVTVIGAFAAFLIGTAGLDGESIALTLGDDGVVRSLFGAGLYLALVAVFGVGLGTLLRSPGGGIATLVGVLLLVPGLSQLLPDSWEETLTPYLPSNAGGAAYALTQAADGLTPGRGIAVFAGWVAVTVIGAAIRLKRADS